MIDRLNFDLNKTSTNVDGIYTLSNHKKIDHDSNCKNDFKLISESDLTSNDTINNPNRCVGLRLLEIKSGDIGINYGCSWGNSLVYVAKNCHTMVAIDQNIKKLMFVQKRLNKENLKNTFLINCKIQEKLHLNKSFNFSIINGTLSQVSGKQSHLNFLKMVNSNLKKDGKLFLAVKNMLSPQYFLTSLWPFSDNQYLYSYSGYLNLLKESGFNKVTTYVVFPDYHFPLKLLPLIKNIKSSYAPVYHQRLKRNFANKIIGKLRTNLDLLIFKKFELFKLSPSFIFIAQSDV